MHLIKLDATRSTNETLKTLWRENCLEDGTIVWALDQYGGRGQQGAIWESEPGKNLTFSVLKKFDKLEAYQHFILNQLVSIGLYKTLLALDIPAVSVKWPNDIMSGSLKLCGILIENFVKGAKLQASIIGIGLNINQEDFGHLTAAASLRTITGREYQLEDVLELLLQKLEDQWPQLNEDSLDKTKTEYESVLYRRGELSTFELPDGKVATGIIQGVSDSGRLLVELQNSTQSFDLKEIRLLE